MNMKRYIITLVISFIALVAVSAHAQIPIGPFAPTETENFDTLASGHYLTFPGFNGLASFSRTTLANALYVTNQPGLLPALSNPNAMFGRGTDVRIRFDATLKLFGGHFRVPNAGIVVNWAQFIFYRSGVPIGGAAAPVNNAWAWIGYDLSGLGGFDQVEIYGTGIIDGYVGMDRLSVY